MTEPVKRLRQADEAHMRAQLWRGLLNMAVILLLLGAGVVAAWWLLMR